MSIWPCNTPRSVLSKQKASLEANGRAVLDIGIGIIDGNNDGNVWHIKAYYSVAKVVK